MSARGLLLCLSALALAAGVGVWFLLREDAPARPLIELGSTPDLATVPERAEVQPGSAAEAGGEALAEPLRDAAPAPAGAESVDTLLAEDELETKAASQTRASAHGRVLDADGKPVQGARVLASLLSSHRGACLDAPANQGRVREDLSDEAGCFRLHKLDAGVVRIAIRAQGWAPLDLSEQPLPPGESLDLGELRLERGARLAGRVLDAQLRPVDEAQIFGVSAPLFGPVHRLGPMAASLLGTSDSAGRFELDAVAPGAWTLLVHHPRFPQALFSGECLAPKLRSDDLELVLQNGVSLSGEVQEYDARRTPDLEVIAVPTEGAALFQESRPPGASLEWLGGVRRAEIDEIGRFRVEGLPLGMRVGLRVQHKQAAVEPANLDREDPWAPWVQASAGDADVGLRYQAGTSLEFQAVARSSGEPIERLRLQMHGVFPPEPLDELGRVRTLFPQGRVLLHDLRADKLSIDPEYDRNCETSLRIEAPGYDVVWLEPLRMSSGSLLQLGSVALNALPVLEVRVVEASTLNPIGGARVHLHAVGMQHPKGRTHSISITSSEGFARLTSLPPGAASLSVSCAGWEPRELPLPAEATPGAPAFVVELNRGARVQVSVRDPSDSIAPGSVVRLSQESGPDSPGYSRTLLADSRGLVLFTEVPRGPCRLTAHRVDGLANHASGAGDQGSVRQLLIEGGESLELTITVADLSRLTGELWLGRDPLGGATISVESGRRGFEDLGSDMQKFSSSPSVRSDERGGFGPIQLGAGEYSLLIEHEAFGLTTRRVIHVERVATHLILDLDDTSITGRVLDSKGEPIAGASVRLYSDRRSWKEDLRPSVGDFLIPAVDPRIPASETSTDADGQYLLRAVPPGTSLQLVFSLGKRTASRPRIQVAEGRTLERLDARLPDAGSLRIVLSAPLPEPGQHYGVRIVGLEQPPGLGLEARHFDEQSQAVFEELAPGPWWVMVFALDEADRIVEARQRQSVQVKAAKETEFSAGW